MVYAMFVQYRDLVLDYFPGGRSHDSFVDRVW